MAVIAPRQQFYLNITSALTPDFAVAGAKQTKTQSLIMPSVPDWIAAEAAIVPDSLVTLYDGLMHRQ